jgi:hypothetical protein
MPTGELHMLPCSGCMAMNCFAPNVSRRHTCLQTGFSLGYYMTVQQPPPPTGAVQGLSFLWSASRGSSSERIASASLQFACDEQPAQLTSLRALQRPPALRPRGLSPPDWPFASIGTGNSLCASLVDGHRFTQRLQLRLVLLAVLLQLSEGWRRRGHGCALAAGCPEHGPHEITRVLPANPQGSDESTSGFPDLNQWQFLNDYPIE